MFCIHPSDVEVFTASGTGDMGDVTDEYSNCRFTIDGAEQIVPVYVRALFTGGTASAEMQMRVDHCTRDARLNFVLYRWLYAGTDANDGTPYINTRFGADDFTQFHIRDGDIIVFEWTNPASGTTNWGLEVGLADAANLRGYNA